MRSRPNRSALQFYLFILDPLLLLNTVFKYFVIREHDSEILKHSTFGNCSTGKSDSEPFQMAF